MKTISRKLVMFPVLFLLLVLTGCISFGDPLDAEDQERIDRQIRESIEKTFPLPEQILIKTHVGDDLRFTTALSLEEVIAFYREAYTQKGYEEGKDSRVSPDAAALYFRKNAAKVVALEVTKNHTGCEVHIQLKSSEQ